MEQLLKHTPYALPHMTQPLENSFKEQRITQSLENSLKESTKRPQSENVSLKHSKVSNKSSRLTVHASKSGFQKGLSPLNNPRLNISTDAPLVDHSYRENPEMLKSSGSHGGEDLQQSLGDISSGTFTNNAGVESNHLSKSTNLPSNPN
ncbi:hypothetical protein QQ045_009431 [Rhodiola kirilowii]